jgi:ATP-dependent Lon protease
MAPKKSADKQKSAKKQTATKPEKKADKEEPSRLKRLSLEFLTDISAVCQLPSNDVRKVLEGLRKVLLRQLRDKKTARVPNIVALKMKTLKARPATKKVLFGVEKEIKARPETKKVVSSVLKNFRTDSGR